MTYIKPTVVTISGCHNTLYVPHFLPHTPNSGPVLSDGQWLDVQDTCLKYFNIYSMMLEISPFEASAALPQAGNFF